MEKEQRNLSFFRPVTSSLMRQIDPQFLARNLWSYLAYFGSCSNQMPISQLPKELKMEAMQN